MYVKITKGYGWYKGREGEVFNVGIPDEGFIKYQIIPFEGYNILKSDCEEINLNEFDGKISEDFADKLIDCYFTEFDILTINKQVLKEKWTSEGYIKQS